MCSRASRGRPGRESPHRDKEVSNLLCRADQQLARPIVGGAHGLSVMSQRAPKPVHFPTMTL
jgi:hypothetical protein